MQTTMDDLEPSPTPSSSLDVIASYSTALAARDSGKMRTLRAENCVLDIVTRDAFGAAPLTCEETGDFWASWFEGFPEMDYQVTRTIAALSLGINFIAQAHNGPVGRIIQSW